MIGICTCSIQSFLHTIEMHIHIIVKSLEPSSSIFKLVSQGFTRTPLFERSEFGGRSQNPTNKYCKNACEVSRFWR